MSTSSNATQSAEELKEQMGRAIGRIGTGVYVVAVDRGGDTRDGMLTSWICQSAFEPPMISVAVRKDRHILNLLQPGGEFAVSVLAKGDNAAFKNFAKHHTDGMDRFEGLELLDDVKQPVLKNAVSYLMVRSETVVEAGDHFLVLGVITSGAMLNPDAEPMIHLRKNGFQY